MLRCHFFFAITLTHINTALGTRHFTNCTTRLSFARSTTRRSMDRLFDRSSRAIVRARIFEIERAVNQNGVICKVDELHQIYNICVNHFFFFFLSFGCTTVHNSRQITLALLATQRYEILLMCVF